MLSIDRRSPRLIALAVAVVLGGTAPAARAQTDLLVSSRTTNQVLRYDGTTGEFLGIFVDAGSGGLTRPTGMNVGPDGNLYVPTGDLPDGTPGSGNGIRVYSGATGAFIRLFHPGYSVGMAGNGFGPDGNLYASLSNWNLVVRLNGTTGVEMGFIGAGSPLNFTVGISFGPDGNLYVGSFNTNQVLRYNLATGEYLGVFATVPIAGTGGHVGGVRFGPDGYLYVTLPWPGANDILRFNGTTGAYIGSFIPPADPHPQGPITTKFGSDGNLYVACRDSDSVLRYDGTTGAFIDVFASGPELDFPTGLAFIPAVASVPTLPYQVGVGRMRAER